MNLFIKKNGKIFGPFTGEDISRCIGQGLFEAFDQVSTDRFDWIPLTDYQKQSKKKEFQPVEPRLKKDSSFPTPLKTASLGSGSNGNVGNPLRPTARPSFNRQSSAYQQPPSYQQPPAANSAFSQGAQQRSLQGMKGNGKAVSALVVFVAYIAFEFILAPVLGATISPVLAVICGVISLILFIVDIILSFLGFRKSENKGWRIASLILFILNMLRIVITIVAIFLGIGFGLLMSGRS